jgi:hypothetical protein
MRVRVPSTTRARSETGEKSGTGETDDGSKFEVFGT